MDEQIRRVRAMMQRGVPFEGVEDVIEGMDDLSAEQQAALWLLAWAEQDASVRDQVVHEALVTVA